MRSLLVLRQYVNNFIGKYEAYLVPLGKMIFSFIVLTVINSKFGYMEKIDNVAVVLIAALTCSFMPVNFIVLVAAAFIILHMYALSLECAIVMLVLFLVLFLLYFRLSPHDTIAVLLTPLLANMGIPYVMPVAMGLLGGPASAASIGCGVIVCEVLKVINSNAAALSALDSDDMASRFRFIIDSMLDDKKIVLLVLAFSITVFLVYFISQLPLDYSWVFAILAGSVADAIIILVGDMVMDVSVSIGGLIFGSILTIIVGMIIMFLRFNVDYTRTEKVQFEDDEYVYYVKAVPKRTVSVPSKKVKKISSNSTQNVKRRSPSPQGR